MTHNPLDPDDNILPLYDEMEGDSATDEPVVQLPTKEQKSLKGKEKEKAPATRRKRPLNLLELPVDIIRLIIKEVRAVLLSHTPLLLLATDY